MAHSRIYQSEQDPCTRRRMETEYAVNVENNQRQRQKRLFLKVIPDPNRVSTVEVQPPSVVSNSDVCTTSSTVISERGPRRHRRTDIEDSNEQRVPMVDVQPPSVVPNHIVCTTSSIPSIGMTEPIVNAKRAAEPEKYDGVVIKVTYPCGYDWPEDINNRKQVDPRRIKSNEFVVKLNNGSTQKFETNFHYPIMINDRLKFNALLMADIKSRVNTIHLSVENLPLPVYNKDFDNQETYNHLKNFVLRTSSEEERFFLLDVFDRPNVDFLIDKWGRLGQKEADKQEFDGFLNTWKIQSKKRCPLYKLASLATSHGYSRHYILIGLSAIHARKGYKYQIKGDKHGYYNYWKEITNDPYKIQNISIKCCRSIMRMSGRKVDQRIEHTAILSRYLDFSTQKIHTCLNEDTVKAFVTNPQQKDVVTFNQKKGGYKDNKWLPKELLPLDKLPLLDYGIKTDRINGKLFYYFIKQYKAEVIIAENFMQRIDKPGLMSEDEVMNQLSILRHERAFNNLAQSQITAIIKALSCRISILKGEAGTGKTKVITAIAKILEIVNINYGIVSFTGRATSHVKTEICKVNKPIIWGDIQTMHRMIANKKYKNIGGRFNLLIIDECSMVENKLMYKFLKTFKHNYSILLVGDPHQLRPLGSGCFFSQSIESGTIPIVTLTTNFRIEAGDSSSLIGKRAKMVANHLDTDEDIKFLQSDDNDYCQIIKPKEGVKGPDHTQTVNDQLKHIFSKTLTDIKDIRILTHSNVNSDTYNKMVQKEFNLHATKCIDGYRLIFDKKSGKYIKPFNTWKIGDIVISKYNDYGYEIMNGDEGVIVHINVDKDDWRVFEDAKSSFDMRKNCHIIVDFDGKLYAFKLVNTDPKNIVFYDDDDPTISKDDRKELATTDAITLGYASTVHKAQGGEWKCIIFDCPASYGDFLYHNLPYTAMTRAKERLYIIGDRDYINDICSKFQAPRIENMANRLREGNTRL